MVSRFIRAGLLLGAASGAVYLARKYKSGELEPVVDKAKSMAKDIGANMARNDEAVTSSLRSHI